MRITILLGYLSLAFTSLCHVSLNVMIADPPRSFRILHMNSRIFCTIDQFVKTISGTSISISLQRLKMELRIFSLLKWQRGKTMHWWPTVSARLNPMKMVSINRSQKDWLFSTRLHMDLVFLSVQQQAKLCILSFSTLVQIQKAKFIVVLTCILRSFTLTQWYDGGMTVVCFDLF